jgi:hypothetical protein
MYLSTYLFIYLFHLKFLLVFQSFVASKSPQITLHRSKASGERKIISQQEIGAESLVVLSLLYHEIYLVPSPEIIMIVGVHVSRLLTTVTVLPPRPM